MFKYKARLNFPKLSSLAARNRMLAQGLYRRSPLALRFRIHKKNYKWDR